MVLSLDILFHACVMRNTFTCTCKIAYVCNIFIILPLSHVFKLADFGTARELGPDETFISLYGTEEYLFPGLYERALVNPGNRTKFSAKVKCQG